MSKTMLNEKAEQLVMQNRLLEASELYGQICDQDQGDIESWLRLGDIQARLGNPIAAEYSIRQAVTLAPDRAEARLQLANILKVQGRTDVATESYKQALQINPELVEAHVGLGLLYRTRGELGRAVEHLEQAHRIAPKNKEAYEELVSIYFARRRLDKAESITRAALQRMPDYATACNNLGLILHAQGKRQEALNAFQEASRLDVDYVAPVRNLATLSWLTGHLANALEYCQKLVRLEPGNLQNRQNLVQALHYALPDSVSEELSNEIERCFAVKGIDLYEIVKPVTRILKGMSEFARLMELIRGNHFAEIDTAVADDSLALVFSNNLFRQLLMYTLVTDLDFEILMAGFRRWFLRLVLCGGLKPEYAGQQLDFAVALACQYFTNEYVSEPGPDEISMVDALEKQLQDSVDDSDQKSPLIEFGMAVLGMYRPLYLHDWVQDYLDSGEGARSATFRVLMKRQWQDHVEELAFKDSIEPLTDISDANSLSVMNQYEESPYPRWISVGFYEARNHEDILQERFQHYRRQHITDTPIRVLNAGCGTGRHAIMSATRYKDSETLAVDLSLSSLAYAQRSARELGITNISFRHADILQLDRLDQRFHIIESCGVLHHIEDTGAALKILVDLLLPGGVILIGLYSTIARSNIRNCINYLSSCRYGKTIDDVRRARQDIISLEESRIERRVLQSPDFYSLSTCRDLLFHVHEHSYRLSEVAELLKDCGIDFLGFEIKDPKVGNIYKALFPDDPTMTDFDNWDVYEQKYPRTFSQMYKMWCQKPTEH